MRNISSIISSHNNAILRNKQSVFGCNCNNRDNCPLQNKCLTHKTIYRAEVTNNANDEMKIYIGQAAPPFKDRYRNHTKSFRHEVYSTESELGKYVFALRQKGITETIKWSILKQIKSPLHPRSCQLCLNEKMLIINNINDNTSLNKRDEFISKCRHEFIHMLKYVKDVKDDSKD